MITANELIERMKDNNPNDIDKTISELEKLIIKASEENFTSVEVQSFVENLDKKTKNLIISILKMNGYEVVNREHTNKRYRSFFITW